MNETWFSLSDDTIKLIIRSQIKWVKGKLFGVSISHVWLSSKPARQRIEFKLTVKTIEYWCPFNRVLEGYYLLCSHSFTFRSHQCVLKIPRWWFSGNGVLTYELKRKQGRIETVMHLFRWCNLFHRHCLRAVNELSEDIWQTQKQKPVMEILVPFDSHTHYKKSSKKTQISLSQSTDGHTPLPGCATSPCPAPSTRWLISSEILSFQEFQQMV